MQCVREAAGLFKAFKTSPLDLEGGRADSEPSVDSLGSVLP